MWHKSIARFGICQCICAKVTAICIFWICAWVFTCQGWICTVALLCDIWSKYDNFAYLMMYFECVNKFAQHVYFLANSKYANKLLKHMSCGYIHTCLPCYNNTAKSAGFVQNKMQCIWYGHFLNTWAFGSNAATSMLPWF